MPTWKDINAALQSWFSDEPPPAPKPTPRPTIVSILTDYFKGGK